MTRTGRRNSAPGTPPAKIGEGSPDRKRLWNGLTEVARGLLREATARRSEARETRMVGRLVDANHLRVLRVSGAESSPAYLGARTWEVDTVAQILIHVALSHGYSTPCSRAGDLAPTAR